MKENCSFDGKQTFANPAWQTHNLLIFTIYNKSEQSDVSVKRASHTITQTAILQTVSLPFRIIMEMHLAMHIFYSLF